MTLDCSRQAGTGMKVPCVQTRPLPGLGLSRQQVTMCDPSQRLYMARHSGEPNHRRTSGLLNRRVMCQLGCGLAPRTNPRFGLPVGTGGLLEVSAGPPVAAAAAAAAAAVCAPVVAEACSVRTASGPPLVSSSGPLLLFSPDLARRAWPAVPALRRALAALSSPSTHDGTAPEERLSTSPPPPAPREIPTRLPRHTLEATAVFSVNYAEGQEPTFWHQALSRACFSSLQSGWVKIMVPIKLHQQS